MINKEEFDCFIEQTKNNWINVFIAGKVFGGKEGEAPQKAKSFEVVNDTLVIRFEGNERLWVKAPTDLLITNKQITIDNASIIRWGWFYYGRPQTDLNWQEQIYIVRPDVVEKITLPVLDSGTGFRSEIIHVVENYPIISIGEFLIASPGQRSTLD